MVSANLPLLVLRLIRDSSLNEWEILATLHKSFVIDPNARGLDLLKRTLLTGGYATTELGGGDAKLRITTKGMGLLERIELENLAFVSRLTLPSEAKNTRLA